MNTSQVLDLIIAIYIWLAFSLMLGINFIRDQRSQRRRLERLIFALAVATFAAVVAVISITQIN